jgi:hypothetical protein
VKYCEVAFRHFGVSGFGNPRETVVWNREFQTPGTRKPEITWVVGSKGRRKVPFRNSGFRSGRGMDSRRLVQVLKARKSDRCESPCQR